MPKRRGFRPERHTPSQALNAFLRSQLPRHLSAHSHLNRLYRSVRKRPGANFAENVLQAIAVDLEVAENDLAKIPAEGPALVVANHPFGLLDGAALIALLLRVRRDVKVLTNQLLDGIPELRQFCIYVDPLERSSDSQLKNVRGLKQAAAWLGSGGVLATFPAGEVSHWDFRERRVSDPEWNESVGWLARKSKAAAIPVFFRGSNSPSFHALGFLHPALRTLRLPEELLNKRGRSIDVRIGRPVSPELLSTMSSDVEITRYLRWRTYLLAERGRHPRLVPFRPVRPSLKRARPIAEAIPADVLEREVRSLPAGQHLVDQQGFSVFVADAGQIPNVLREIGRLREISFRGVGEGTGKSRDLDRFDSYYKHLFVWDNTARVVVGAYRLGNVPEILNKFGIPGVYTSTLFDYAPEFFTTIGPAWELGRSFVRPEYQKQYASLMLLWKGIALHVAAHPEIPSLLGAVSMSSRYHLRSRELLVRFLEFGRGQDLPSTFLRSRRPLHVASRREADYRFVTTHIRDLEDLSSIVEDLEEDGKGVPILFRHYSKLGGRFLGFNVDPDFNNALDGLVLLDLRQTDPAFLSRLMGRSAYKAFRKHHGLEPSNARRD